MTSDKFNPPSRSFLAYFFPLSVFHVAVLQHYNLFNIKDKLGLVEFRPIGHSPVISPSGRSTLLPNSVPSAHLQRVHPNPSSRYNTDIKQDEPQC